MRMTITNNLHLAMLQLAYKVGLGIVSATFYPSVQGAGQVSSTPKKLHSRLLWLLIGVLVIGLMRLIPPQDLISSGTGAATIVLIVLLAIAIAKKNPLISGSFTLPTRVKRPAQTTLKGNYSVSTLTTVPEQLFPPSLVNHKQASKTLIGDEDHDQLLARNATEFMSGSQEESKSERSNRREALAFEVVNQIRNSLELDIILETTVQSIRSFLQIDRCQFLWCKSLEIGPDWEVVNEARNPLLTSQLGSYPTELVEAFGARLLNQPIIQINQVKTCSDSVLQPLLLKLGYTSIVLIPIQAQAGEIGVVSCAHCTQGRVWDEQELELLQVIVAQLAIAINQAQLCSQAHQSALRAQARSQQLELALQQLQATQAQLVQNAKMSSLGQLVAGIAHEINNPVNFIHGNLTYVSNYIYDLVDLLHLYQKHYPNPAPPLLQQAEVIEIDFITDDLPKILRSMQLGTDRIRTIVRSLQNFSRSDEAQMKQVDLHEGINNTLLILQHRLKAKGQKPEIQVLKEFSDLPRVECYPGQLNQVFVNILSNAIDALEHSRVETQAEYCPTITIRTSLVNSCDSTPTSLARLTKQYPYRAETEAPVLLDSQYVVIQIADNGPGMTESIQAEVFDPFFTTKPIGQGFGLGLSISYQIIVERHQGALTCTSTPGQGTEFRIEIPLQPIQ